MLTQKQELFAQAIVEGKNQAEAYRSAYNAEKMSNNAVYREASLLMSNPNIAQRINELRDQLAKSTILTVQERLEYLSRVIKGEESEKYVQFIEGEKVVEDIPPSIKTRLNALDIMNKMQGEYTTKIEGDIKIKRLEDLL
ncbi:MAG: terminase small subunit [Clostridia bacterium]|nr:terminase small subunit [Clostridia bacterium]